MSKTIVASAIAVGEAFAKAGRAQSGEGACIALSLFAER